MAGLVIPVHARPEYLVQTFESLAKSKLPEGLKIVLVNDANTDPITLKEFRDFFISGVEVIRINNEQNEKCWGSLRKGFDYLYHGGCDILINLDSDMVVNPDWFERMYSLYEKFPNSIISGFNSNLHGNNEIKDGYRLNDSIGGANLMFSRNLYFPFIREYFDRGNAWDWQMGNNYISAGNKFIVTVPSAMQHIGHISTIWGPEIRFSTADDFVPFKGVINA